MEKRVLIQNIRLDGGTQTRITMNKDVIAEYAELMKGEGNLPPIQLVQDGSTYWLWDGFHRLYAAKQNKADMILAEVQPGDINTAQWLAVAANQSHGLRRTNADKANAAKMALSKWPDQSDHRLAEHIGVAHQTVAKYRKETVPQLANLANSNDEPASKSPPMRRGKDDKLYPATKPLKEPKASFFDEVNMEIPERLWPVWQRRTEAEEISKDLKRIRLLFERVAEKKDPFFATFNIQHIVASLKNAQNSIDAEIPYAVCVYCGGDGCKVCNGRGLLGKLNHDLAPADMKRTMGITS